MSFPDDSRRSLRCSVYALLIAVGTGSILGRLMAVDSVDKIAAEKGRIDAAVESERKKLEGQGVQGDALDEQLRGARARFETELAIQRPFLSANDRSRWCTVRALVERGTYAIDDIMSEPNWDTIDMVKHRDAAGNEHYYSSKPPLLATLVAGEYWIVNRVTGLTLGTHPFELGRFMLITINAIPLVIYFLVMARLIERIGVTDWGKLFAMTAAVFGTFLTTFAVVLNNHLIGAVSAALTLEFAARVWYDGNRRWAVWFSAGLFAAFTVACELPALSFFALLTAGLLWKAPRETLVGYLPGAVLIAAAFFGTNYLAHGSLIVPYAYRGEVPVLFSVGWQSEAELDQATFPEALRSEFEQHQQKLPEKIPVLVVQEGHRWLLAYDDPQLRYIVEREGDQLNVRGWNWNNWYQYTVQRTRDGRQVDEPSYWFRPIGIDQGEKSTGVYALHALVGHHGIFSLTPMWLLSLVGLGLMWSMAGGTWRPAAVLIGVTSLVCVVFFLMLPPIDRNYGGMTSGLRWFFWLAPLWLVALVPAADGAARRRWTQAMCLVLLALSVLAVSYPTWNPWTQPWLWNLFKSLGWM